MECFNSENNFGSVKFNSPFWKPLLAPQMIKKFASIQKIHHHIELILRLKSVMHVNQERTVHFLHDLPFWLSVINLISSENVIFVEYFHGEKMVSAFLLDQKYFAEGSSSDDFKYSEIIFINILGWIRLVGAGGGGVRRIRISISGSGVFSTAESLFVTH